MDGLTDPEILQQFGYLALFMSCFAAATILPFSSEVIVISALALGWSPILVLITAGLGNCAGASTNYLLGYYSAEKMFKKIKSDHWGRKLIRWNERWGRATLWLNPLPVLGDLVCILAGIGRVSWQYFMLLTFGLRIARYAIITIFF